MARNIEIKARIPSVEALLPVARALADGEPQLIVQDDRFYACARGRLKLRFFCDGSGELIHYHRADETGPKLSDYVRTPTTDVASLHEALARGLGEIGRVRKHRLLLKHGNTRIHLDRVDGLGDFLELEVVLRDGQSSADGQRIVVSLMASLGIAPEQCLAGAYLELLADREAARGPAGRR
jgi:predicted adenylyl cyclase CyaB